MLEKIVRRRWYLQKHLDAPLLKEREAYLETLVKKRPYKHGYLLSTADYLLLIVNDLHLKDGEKTPVLIDEIKGAAVVWSKKIKNHPMKKTGNTPTSVEKYMAIAFAWLTFIGRMDPLYTNESNIINRLFERKFHKLRYLTYPLLKRRIEYLEKWANQGAARQTLREIAAYQLHLIDYLHVDSVSELTMNDVYEASEKWKVAAKPRLGDSEGLFGQRRFISHAKGWLMDLGILKIPGDIFPFKEEIDVYLDWFQNDQGASPRTAEGRYSQLKKLFLNLNIDSLQDITPLMLDKYLQKRHDEDGDCRRTIQATVTDLRVFFRYAEKKGLCRAGLADSLKAPRVYKNEDIPSFVPWKVVVDILQSYKEQPGIGTRKYAILLLLSVYGLRSSEVTEMKLKDIDWREETLYLRRAKNCKPQILPLLPIVGDAIIRYIKEERFNQLHDEHLFLAHRAPHGPLSTPSIYQLVSSELKKRNVAIKHRGPHSLRHACATRLINTGKSLKEIADLLGHMQLDTTRVYAKVDMVSLRKVSDMKWEDLI